MHRCTICNKTYSSRQNLWKHNNKFHVIKYSQNNCKITINDFEGIQNSDDTTANDCKMYSNDSNIIKCIYCKKIFTRKNKNERLLNDINELYDKLQEKYI